MTSERIEMPSDEMGRVGRECPNDSCQRYFKIKFGTGLTDADLPCRCPYCGHSAPHDDFWTQDQLKLFQSEISKRYVDPALNEMAQEMARSFRHNRDVEFKASSIRTPVHRYAEAELETSVTCDKCTLVFEVYGVFAFCPDCGHHNSLAILAKNLDIVSKSLELASRQEKDLRQKQIENALEDCVSSFDGFGREVCRTHAEYSTESSKCANISFQNIGRAGDRFRELFGLDLADVLQADQWDFTKRCFQKRHLFEHTMGVVDEAYLKATNDPLALVGRKILVTADEVSALAAHIRLLGRAMHSHFSKLGDR